MNIMMGNSGLIGMNVEKGFTISILIHLLILGVVISTTSTIQPAPKLMVIDFSITESSVKTMSSKQIQKKQTVPVPSVVKQITQTIPVKPPKTVPEKKVVRIIPKPDPPLKPKIAAIKQKVRPPVKAEPKLQPKFIPELLPQSAPQTQEEVSLLAQSTPVPTKAIEQPTVKTLPNFPAPAAGKSSIKNAHNRVSKYTKAQFNNIQQGIQKQITYPRTARRMGWEGKVVVEFIICKDGTVKNVHIVESSGFKALDKSAVTTIKKAAPFPIPPIDAKLIIPVIYRLS